MISRTDRVLLFGGLVSDAYSNETWVFDVDTNMWINLDPDAHPSARSSHAMAYDSQSDRAVLFGGQGTGFLPER